MSVQQTLENGIQRGDVGALAGVVNLRDVLSHPIYGTFTSKGLTLTNPLPLQLAVLFERAEVVQLFLETGANPNQQHAQSNSPPPLHIAVVVDRPDIVQLLVAKGAFLEAKNEAGLTPLHASLLLPNTQTFSTLLQLGAQQMATNPSGDTVIQAAARLGRWQHYALISGGACQPASVCVDALQWETLKAQVTAMESMVAGLMGKSGGVCPICRMTFPHEQWVEHVRRGCHGGH